MDEDLLTLLPSSERLRLLLPAPPDPDAEGSSIEASYNLVITVNDEIAIKNNISIRNHLEISQNVFCFTSL